MAGLKLVTFADAAGSRAGVLLDDGRVLDLGAAMPPARDMIAGLSADVRVFTGGGAVSGK